MPIINCFFIYSVLGFFFEATYNLITSNHFSSGIMYGPWTPIYGIGAILTIQIHKFIFEKSNQNKFVKNLMFFIAIIIVLTILEWLGGILLESIFHETLWNYKNYKFHIGKFIALEISLSWAVLGFVLVYLIKPIVDKIEPKIPKIITIILIILYVIDTVVTIITKLK